MWELEKLIINEQDVVVITCKKVENTRSKLYDSKGRVWNTFGADTPAYIVCLDELRKQQVINEKVYDQMLVDDTVRKLAWEGLQKNMVMGGDMMIDRKASEVFNPQVDSTHWKDKC